jgi:hypothetical protein
MNIMKIVVAKHFLTEYAKEKFKNYQSYCKAFLLERGNGITGHQH